MSRPMSSAGAECVSAPIEMKSAPGPCVSAGSESSVTPPDTSTSAAPSSSVDGRAHLAGRHVVEHDEVDAGGARFVDLFERVALDLDDAPRPARPGPGDGLGDAAAPRDGCP